jgi:hypothetical protein
MSISRLISRIVFAGVFAVSAVFSQNETTPGELTTPYPTVTAIAVDWEIEGDANGNCSVSVRYRKEGGDAWNEAMPLFRVPGDGNLGFSWSNRMSGSLFDLAPGTTYEIRLLLNDPDGGSAEETITATTRPVPRIEDNAVVVELEEGSHDVLRPENGTANAPRVYYSADGDAVYDYIDMRNRSWVYLWGITVNCSGENSSRAIRMDGAENCAVRYCNLNGLYGITAYDEGVTDCYIADNVITGNSRWNEPSMGANGDNEGEGIQFTGSGNVICHNRVTGFRDCISTMEDDGVSEQQCIDIYNNDVYVGADDAIEADFCFSNCRVMRNRITNSYVGVSSQPGLGGPNYFIRNVMYNVVHGAFKFKRSSRGDVALHNTVVKVGAGLAGNDAMDYAWFRNNLAIGGPDGDVDWGGYGAGNPYAADIRDPGEHSSFDYDAVGVYEVRYVAKIGGEPFGDIEPHGIENIQLEDLFEDVVFPNPPVPERDVPDLRPAAGSPVEDKGVRLPNVNDHFAGDAPDIGAYERESALPVYGPRPDGMDEGSGSVVAPRITDRHNTKIPLLQCHYSGATVYLSWTGIAGSEVAIALYRLSGECVVYRTGKTTENGNGQTYVPTAFLASGCYLVRLSTVTSHLFGKILVN